MRLSYRVWLILLCLCSGPLWAAPPWLRYLSDIGDLGTDRDPRTSVRFGRVQAVLIHDQVRFQGRGDAGKKWQATLPVRGGLIGFTTVWQADFDHSSRPGLLIATFFPGNGRCVNPITLSFLLFDDHGEPVPWVIQTFLPEGHKFPQVPAIFTSLNLNGLPQLVVTDCEYSTLMPPGSDIPWHGEDWRIAGIYQAKDTAWNLVKPDQLAPYTALVRRNHRLELQSGRLLKTNPTDWPDQGNRLDPQASPPVRVTAMLPPAEECSGVVHLPPVVDGKLQTAGWKDPCDEIGLNRIKLSNGTTCYDWPMVMLDGENGREIVAESEHPEALLETIVEQRRNVVLAGQRDPKRCSPVLLWAPRPQ